MESIPKFLRWFSIGALAIVLLTFAQGAWLQDHGKALRKDDVSANGIGDFQLANEDRISRILNVWDTSRTVELRPYIFKVLKIGDDDGKPHTLIQIAETDTRWDFLFIVFYGTAVFIFLNKAMSFWRLSHLKIVLNVFHKGEYAFLSFLSGKKTKIALIWAAVIAICDVVENFVMLHAFKSFEKGAILLPVYFATPKFAFLLLAFIFVAVTFLFFAFLLIINSPQVLWHKFRKFLDAVNDPY